MSKRYVETEKLEQLFCEYGLPTTILEELREVTAEEAAEDLSTRKLIDALEEKEDVFAVQIWEREDIEAVLLKKEIEKDEALVRSIAKEVKPMLENCTLGWDQIDGVVDRLMKERV